MSKFAIQVKQLSKSFYIRERKTTLLQASRYLFRKPPQKTVIDDISCEINQGQGIALLGHNGCGKTTFLRLISGIYEKDGGNIEINGILRVLFKSSFSFNNYIPVIDNIFLVGSIHGIERKALKEKVPEILSFAHLENLEYAMLKELSSGQLQRLALSIFFHAQADVFIFDEVLESIDRDFIKKCDDYFNSLLSDGKTFIITSHQTDLLKKYCSKAILLEGGKIKMYGDFDSVYRQYEHHS